MKLNRSISASPFVTALFATALLGAATGARAQPVPGRQIQGRAVPMSYVQRANPNHRAQSTTSPAASQALIALQSDLEAAITSMTAALPIYDGDRVHSIHAAHRSLVMVDHAIAGRNAQARRKPTVTDHVKSGTARGKYTSQQIAASQQSMQAGLNSLLAAQKDLLAAEGTTPNKKGAEVSKLLQKAVSDAQKAIAIHATHA